jgi:hypothetical protein
MHTAKNLIHAVNAMALICSAESLKLAVRQTPAMRVVTHHGQSSMMSPSRIPRSMGQWQKKIFRFARIVMVRQEVPEATLVSTVFTHLCLPDANHRDATLPTWRIHFLGRLIILRVIWRMPALSAMVLTLEVERDRHAVVVILK